MITVIKYLYAIIIIFLFTLVATIAGLFMFPISIIVELIAFISDFINDTDNFNNSSFTQYLTIVKEYIKIMWYKLTY